MGGMNIIPLYIQWSLISGPQSNQAILHYPSGDSPPSRSKYLLSIIGLRQGFIYVLNDLWRPCINKKPDPTLVTMDIEQLQGKRVKLLSCVYKHKTTNELYEILLGNIIPLIGVNLRQHARNCSHSSH